MIIKNIKKNKAFVLLFTMVLSSIVLAIALGVMNIAYKEVKFGTSAKDANDAFFAADAGIECALYYDKNLSVNDDFQDSFPLICADNEDIIFSSDNALGGTFIIEDLNESEKSCVKVNISKNNFDINGDPFTKIISKGYNMADDGCNPNKNSVERQLEVTY